MQVDPASLCGMEPAATETSSPQPVATSTSVPWFTLSAILSAVFKSTSAKELKVINC